MTTKVDEFSEVRALSNVFVLLGRIWLRELDQEFKQAFESGSIRLAWLSVGGVGKEELNLDEMSEEYCRLFIGPKDHFPPYQSVWTEGEFRGKCVESVKKYYSILPDARLSQFGVEPDHLGLQLTFAGMLMSEYADAENTARSSIREAIEQFSQDHLRWPRDLIKLSGDAAQTSFYRTMIVWTKELLRNSQVYLNALGRIR